MSEGVRVHGRCYGGEADWRGEGAGGEGVLMKMRCLNKKKVPLFGQMK
jgi:hypothetical protein